MISHEVYTAARRAYLLTSTSLFADDETVLAWARTRWPNSPVDDIEPDRLAFWVMSAATQEGHE